MTHNFDDIHARLAAVQDSIQQLAVAHHRAADAVALLAVSKTQPADALRAAAAAGQRRFGENYLQEALTKMAELADLELEWHFIGPLQSNKTRPIAENFAWVHSVDRLKLAERLSAQRPESLPALNICLQVNISDEDTKSGCSLDELPALAQAVAALPRLRLRGLMAIPVPAVGLEQQRLPFRRLYTAQQQLITAGLPLDTLSMGMSDDMEAAIAEGASIVRVGTAIFGARK